MNNYFSRNVALAAPAGMEIECGLFQKIVSGVRGTVGAVLSVGDVTEGKFWSSKHAGTVLKLADLVDDSGQSLVKNNAQKAADRIPFVGANNAEFREVLIEKECGEYYGFSNVTDKDKIIKDLIYDFKCEIIEYGVISSPFDVNMLRFLLGYPTQEDMRQGRTENKKGYIEEDEVKKWFEQYIKGKVRDKLTPDIDSFDYENGHYFAYAYKNNLITSMQKRVLRRILDAWNMTEQTFLLIYGDRDMLDDLYRECVFGKQIRSIG